MARPPNPGPGPHRPAVYHIQVEGHLGPRWQGWFAPLTVTPNANGTTLLTGPIVDQAALHGILTKVRDLGLPLLSIVRVDSERDTNH